MSQSPDEAAAERELAEDSLSALTFESDTETKLKKKTSRKPPKSPKSPYTSSTCFHSKKAGFLRTLKGTDSKHFEIPLVKASRQLWHGSFKQGAWMNQTKSDPDVGPVLTALPGSTPEYLKEALGMKKPKHARSASSGYIPGTPDYKEKEDMYDEIIELKKTIQAQKSEADRMKTKLRRLEEENNRKDKQIEQLLDPSRWSEFGWVRAEQKNDTSSMLNGLKQKILKLEQQCKEKDNTINKLQTDVKSTNVEEMKIALQTYYEEIQRLQTLLAKTKTVQRKSPPESKQQKVLNAAILQLSRSIKELQDENRKLKADLEHAMSSSPASGRAKNYTEWSRQRLVRRISRLEKKMDEMQNGRLSETSTSSLLAQLGQSAAEEGDPPEERERLRRLVNKLKGQRDVLQNHLAAKEEEIQKLTEKVGELEGNQEASCRLAGIDATKPPNQGLQKCRPSWRPLNPACMLKFRASDLECSPACSPEHHRKEQAARVIQGQWKAYQTKIDRAALDEAVVVLQAAFRGHLARQKLLSINAQGRNSPSVPRIGHKATIRNSLSSRGSSSSQTAADYKAEEDAVRLVQSVFRAHTARTHLEEWPLILGPGGERASPAASDGGEKKPAWSPFKYSPLAFTSAVHATSSHDQLQPSPSPPADEVQSDDSDDIITVSPSPVKKTSSHDFTSHLSHSLLHS
ncbi:IQ domain-containing protein E [Lacerta agilis]|uniref:IQ domain-containing protein E n=1 Tax=Lacerta agilis TaxID=80427 RepID=UPI00141A5942|nr:IQ domain-containing protein E [Lacerta agilis]